MAIRQNRTSSNLALGRKSTDSVVLERNAAKRRRERRARAKNTVLVDVREERKMRMELNAKLEAAKADAEIHSTALLPVVRHRAALPPPAFFGSPADRAIITPTATCR